MIRRAAAWITLGAVVGATTALGAIPRQEPASAAEPAACERADELARGIEAGEAIMAEAQVDYDAAVARRDKAAAEAASVRYWNASDAVGWTVDDHDAAVQECGR